MTNARTNWILIVIIATLDFARGASAVMARDNMITAVSLERTACFGECPVYKISIQSDGRTFYTGVDHVPPDRIGSFEGTLEFSSYRRLTEFLKFVKFDQMNEVYRKPLPDLPHAITTVVSDASSKTVDNYGDSGPVELWAVENVVDALIAQVSNWKKVSD